MSVTKKARARWRGDLAHASDGASSIFKPETEERLGVELRHWPRGRKSYFRPPAGESWRDVILRQRSVLHTISLHSGGKRVLIVGASGDRSAHALPESRRGILAIDAEGVVLDERSNAAAALRLDRYDFVAPLKEARAPETNPRLTSKSSTAPRAKLFPV